MGATGGDTKGVPKGYVDAGSVSYNETIDGDNVSLPNASRELTSLCLSVITVLAKNGVLDIRETCNEFFETFDKVNGFKTWTELNNFLMKFMSEFTDNMSKEDKIVFKLENEGKFSGNKRR